MRPELVLSHEERKRRFVNERVKEELEKIKNVRDKTKNNNKSEDLTEDVDDIHENIDVIEITQEEECSDFYIYNLLSYKHKKFRIRSHEFNFSSINS